MSKVRIKDIVLGVGWCKKVSSRRKKKVQESLAMQLVSGEEVGMAAMVLKFEIIERRISKLEALGSGYVRLKNYSAFHFF